MGKKSKTGKQRKDVFYRRAKEAGYRARAAYKLIQLNKKYNFLQSSRVCIDLCAAPGSWMQVATKFMPVSSVVIGIDRYPISPIPNTIAIQGDITTEKVRQDLKAQLKTWKADLVLHDGAPNVGQNWLHDAYQQNLLVLHSFKLACEFLMKGGSFVTKVFRSKDHLSLQYVFKKLFKRVEATKPIASRFESAEIFVVCQGFLAPDKVDPQFFDPKFVFQSLENEPKNKIDILKPEKNKRKAEGYEEGITMLYKKNKISNFIKSPNYVDILEQTNEFEWDSTVAKESIHTTNEIVEFCKDIKVLGRKELRMLLNWRKKIIEDFEELAKSKKSKCENLVNGNEEEKDEIEKDLEELEQIQQEVSKLQSEKSREEKQHRKKIEKRKRKLGEKMKLRMMVPGDPGPQETGNNGLFTVKTLDNSVSLNNVVDQEAEILAESDDDDSDSDEKKNKFEYYSKEGTYLDSSGNYRKATMESESESESEDSDAEGLNILNEADLSKKQKKSVTFSEDLLDDDTNKHNPLTTDLVGDNVLDKRERKAETWFSKEIFENLEDDEIEDFEIESCIKQHKESGGIIRKNNKRLSEEDYESGYTSDSEKNENKRQKMDKEFTAKDAPDSDSDSDIEPESLYIKNNREVEDSKESQPKDCHPKKKPIKLDEVGLALATRMIKSKKEQRDIYDAAWNRYMYGDEDLPDWFLDDEKKHNMPEIKVDKNDLRMYQEKNKAVDSRTIKKVVEAKARKQRKLKKRMARAKKKAEVVSNNMEMSEREKAQEMKKIYKKAAAVLKPKSKTYVIMKKQYGGRKPRGVKVKGPYKMVDKRMKKDKRATEVNTKRAKTKKR